MSLENEEVKKFEKAYTTELFRKVQKISLKQDSLISLFYYSQFIDSESEMPNLGIALNNKLNELQNEFQNAGISMYSQQIENYESLKSNTVGTSFIGDAIISDLINYANQGTQILVSYEETMKEATDKKVEKGQSLVKASPFRRLWGKIKSFLTQLKQEPNSNAQEEANTINSHLSNYQLTYKQLCEYNLRDNIIISIVKKIREHSYEASKIPTLLKESVIHDLKKLGLEDLIPQLQQELIEEYKNESQEQKSNELTVKKDCWMEPGKNIKYCGINKDGAFYSYEPNEPIRTGNGDYVYLGSLKISDTQDKEKPIEFKYDNIAIWCNNKTLIRYFVDNKFNGLGSQLGNIFANSNLESMDKSREPLVLGGLTLNNEGECSTIKEVPYSIRTAVEQYYIANIENIETINLDEY